ncbi:putative Histidine kinase [Candidatus Zixiibacteriota bacterium]|nr:putative Histidine kinase [candidate division Zixibacteria bacterium]
MKTKKKDFQVEVSLGVALIVLVMVALNFASHYALFRVRESLENQVREELTEAAVAATDDLIWEHSLTMSDSAASAIKKNYGVKTLSLIPMTYERVLEIQKEAGTDSIFMTFDPTLALADLRPLLHNQSLYRYNDETATSLVFFPAEHLGSRYVVVAGKENTLLGSVQNAGKILIYFAILGIAVIIYASIRLIHFVINPFNRLKEKAAAFGKYDSTANNEVAELIDTYEGIINDLKGKEEELRRLNDYITRRAEDLEIYNNYILKSIQTGVITIDNDGQVATLNRAAAGMLGLEYGARGGENFRVTLGPYPGLLNLIDEYLAEGDSIQARDLQLPDTERGEIILSASITPLLDSEGDRLGLSLILNDRTEARRLQQELELNRRMASLGEMSGGLAHQLRNSTAAIMGFARLIDKRTEESTPVKENVGSLLKEAREAAELVGRFLDFAKPLKLDGQEFNMEALLAEVRESHQRKYPEVTITLENNCQAGCLVSGDPLLLKQALGNVIDNGCKAISGKNGRVAINLINVKQGLEINIADNGPGIPEEAREKIFTPFYSGSPSGAGLGLSLAQKIVSLHGGLIDFCSSLETGTIFTIILPQPKSKGHRSRANAAANQS